MNIFLFTAQILSFGVSFMLPAVGISLYMWKIDENQVKPKDTEMSLADADSLNPKFAFNRATKLLWEHFTVSYSNRTVLIWSIWWALSTAGYLQVISYVQLLWKEIESKQGIYNGAVEALLTLFGALSASLVS